MENKVETKSICTSCNRNFNKVDEFPKFKVLSVKKCELRKFIDSDSWVDSISNPEILDGIPKEELKKLSPIENDFNNIEKVYLKNNLIYRKFEVKNGNQILTYFDVRENTIERYRELYEKKSKEIIKLFAEGEVKSGKFDDIYKIKNEKGNHGTYFKIEYEIKSLGNNKFLYTYKLYEMGRIRLGAFTTSADYICDLLEVILEGIKNEENTTFPIGENRTFPIGENKFISEAELKSKIYELAKEYNKIHLNTETRMIVDFHPIGCCCNVCWYKFGSKDDKRDDIQSLDIPTLPLPSG